MTAIVDRRSDYVSAVAVELGDLAPEDRSELIEELDDHVAALLEDRPDADLVAELGTPRAYAAELRAAAGLSGPADSRLSWAGRARALREQAAALVPPGARPYLAGARPVWWVARGYVLAAALALWTGNGTTWEIPFVPSFGGNWVLGAVVALLVMIASVRLGAWRPPTPTYRALLAVVNAVAVLAALFVAVQARRLQTSTSYLYDTQYVPNCPIELSNLYGYDASGRPLSDVRLYDQNGNPFDLSVFGCNAGQFSPSPGATNAYPWPSATSDPGVVNVPTGPPSSLAPLPGATNSATDGATVSASITPGASSTVPPAASATP